MSLKVAVQMDHVATINPTGDSTFAMMLEAQARGHELLHYTPDTLSLKGDVVSALAQPITVTDDWTESTLNTRLDADQWTCLGSRHDRMATYGHRPLETVLADVNTDILLVLFPLDIAPMGPLDDDPHSLRPEVDYPVWRSRLPEGYVSLDEVRIKFS